MKMFQWVVMIRCNSGSFYGCVAPGRYLIGVAHDAAAGCYKPQFGDGDPVLYPRKSAAFQAAELRRVGYNVRCVPFMLLSFVSWLRARKSRPWKR